MTSRPSILLCTEGTYPHYLGGVSVWCEQLISNIPEADFHVLSVVHTPVQPVRFKLPANVVSVTPVALWGTEFPGDRCEPVSELSARRAATVPAVIAERFVPPFRSVVRSILNSGANPDALGRALLDLHGYFQSFDLYQSFCGQAWEAFLGEIAECPRFRGMTLAEASMCLGWLARFFSILTTPLPRATVTHSSLAGLAGIPGVLLRIRDGVPYVLSEHGILLREVYASMANSEYPDACRAFLIAYHRAIAAANYHFADVITSLGDFNAGWQKRFGAHPGKIRYMPNGVDPRRFLCAPAPAPRPTVLTLARIYALKGITNLIESAAIVRRSVPNVRFRILGEIADIDYFDECKALVARHGLQDHIEFCESDNPAEEYRSAWVYCLPSVSEAMPFVILEAMMSGCPVVATNVGNVAQTLGQCGLLAQPNNPLDLAAQLVTLLQGPHAPELRSRLTSSGMQRARATFTIEAATGRFRELYQEITKCRHLSLVC